MVEGGLFGLSFIFRVFFPKQEIPSKIRPWMPLHFKFASPLPTGRWRDKKQSRKSLHCCLRSCQMRKEWRKSWGKWPTKFEQFPSDLLWQRSPKMDLCHWQTAPYSWQCLLLLGLLSSYWLFAPWQIQMPSGYMMICWQTTTGLYGQCQITQIR